MILPQREFRDVLEKSLHRHLTLSHPIFEELLAPGARDIELLRKVALQGYQLTKHFLTYVEYLFFYCPRCPPTSAHY